MSVRHEVNLALRCVFEGWSGKSMESRLGHPPSLRSLGALLANVIREDEIILHLTLNLLTISTISLPGQCQNVNIDQYWSPTRAKVTIKTR
jgi:hypothetical protein